MEIMHFFAACGGNAGTGILSSSCLPQTAATPDTLKTILNTVFIIVGGLSVLFLVIAGTRYVFSQGEPEKVQKAKNEIRYSLIGLLIAAFSSAVVNYLLLKVL